ncbi:RES family NAD+ phosphorylase [Rhodovulum sulfidophilum]|uniref:RES family NAD+ phosphorylase n=1 Tax=Rhodovulum sulfidophilum TaxID=35806 RepID=UPI001389F435|nr:RES family NAD+ phosphorylase [Rhodovulum sulfidophilum]NDK37020.1 RES family NAD+ phosphorylase [Rhodovulum sulfidophilum]
MSDLLEDPDRIAALENCIRKTASKPSEFLGYIEAGIHDPLVAVAVSPFIFSGGNQRFGCPGAGAYYAGNSFSVAISETLHHYALFLRKTPGVKRNELRCYCFVNRVNCDLVRILSGAVLNIEGHGDASADEVLDPDCYTISQTLAADLRARGESGVVYPSVRQKGGECVAIFRIDGVEAPHDWSRLLYDWEGDAFSSVWHCDASFNKIKIFKYL